MSPESRNESAAKRVLVASGRPYDQPHCHETLEASDKMPFCTDCESWFPGSVSRCEACGGALTAERPASVVKAAAAGAVSNDGPDRLWSWVKMPDPDAEILDPQEVSRLVRAFDAARERARGRHAAPASWLPASGTRVPTASWMPHCQAEEEGDWPGVRRAAGVAATRLACFAGKLYRSLAAGDDCLSRPIEIDRLNNLTAPCRYGPVNWDMP